MAGFFRKLFSKNEPEADEDLIPAEFEEEDEGSSFVWTEHMRIVLAIVVVILGACVMWWIVA